MDFTEELTPDERKILMVDEGDWLSCIACKLTKGRADNTGANGSLVSQQFLFNCLEFDWQGSFSIGAYNNPAGIEQLGHRVIMLWYHSKAFNKSYPMGAVSVSSGEVWIDGRYSYYNAIDLLKAPALQQKFAKLRLAPRKVKVTPQQQQVIASIMGDIADHRGNWAEFFSASNSIERETL